MVPVEIGEGSLSRDNYDSDQNFILQRWELDLLEAKWHDSQLISVAPPGTSIPTYLIQKKFLQNKSALDPSCEGPFKIAKVLTPGSYKLSYLSGEQISRSWNADHLKMYY